MSKRLKLLGSDSSGDLSSPIKSLLSSPSPKDGFLVEKVETRKRDPNPPNVALLVIDLQNHFSSMAKPILHNALATIDLCRRASIPVFFTHHVHKSLTTDTTMLGEWWNELQLQLYGLYKIATEGGCTAPQPSALKMTSRAKWDGKDQAGAFPAGRRVRMKKTMHVLYVRGISSPLSPIHRPRRRPIPRNQHFLFCSDLFDLFTPPPLKPPSPSSSATTTCLSPAACHTRNPRFPLSVAPAMEGLKPAISLTDNALRHLNKMRSERGEDLCLRIGVKQGGYSGMSYTMDFENRANVRPDDSTIEYQGFAIG
ncbi:hypothetical protein Bca4012_047440 [Brassica carinata]